MTTKKYKRSNKKKKSNKKKSNKKTRIQRGGSNTPIDSAPQTNGNTNGNTPKTKEDIQKDLDDLISNTKEYTKIKTSMKKIDESIHNIELLTSLKEQEKISILTVLDKIDDRLRAADLIPRQVMSNIIYEYGYTVDDVEKTKLSLGEFCENLIQELKAKLDKLT